MSNHNTRSTQINDTLSNRTHNIHTEAVPDEDREEGVSLCGGIERERTREGGIENEREKKRDREGERQSGREPKVNVPGPAAEKGTVRVGVYRCHK